MKNVKVTKKMQKTFKKAAEYIKEHGWCQGDEENRDGEVCALGALRNVEAEDTAIAALAMSLEYRRVCHCDCIEDAIINWNDDLSENRGKRTVVDRFLRLAGEK